jgi:hypothetical protein
LSSLASTSSATTALELGFGATLVSTESDEAVATSSLVLLSPERRGEERGDGRRVDERRRVHTLMATLGAGGFSAPCDDLHNVTARLSRA